MIKYIKIDDNCFDVIFKNGVKMGQLLKEVDGYFVFYPDLRGGFWSSWILKDIGNKLDELNKEWDEFVEKNLSNVGDFEEKE